MTAVGCGNINADLIVTTRIVFAAVNIAAVQTIASETHVTYTGGGATEIITRSIFGAGRIGARERTRAILIRIFKAGGTFTFNGEISEERAVFVGIASIFARINALSGLA